MSLSALDLEGVRAAARQVLQANRVEGRSDWGGRTYSLVCPARVTYPFQWFWDSAFHAIALPVLARAVLAVFQKCWIKPSARRCRGGTPACS
jgi:hypothetical protein